MLGDDLQPHPFKVDRGVGLLEVQVGDELAMLEAQRSLDQTSDPGSRLQVADVRLHRPNHHRRIGRVTARRERSSQRTRFDGIPYRGTRAVSLDVIDARGRKPSLREYP